MYKENCTINKNTLLIKDSIIYQRYKKIVDMLFDWVFSIVKLREDDESMQWFALDEDKNMLYEKEVNALNSHLYHKATVEELINHFKK